MVLSHYFLALEGFGQQVLYFIDTRISYVLAYSSFKWQEWDIPPGYTGKSGQINDLILYGTGPEVQQLYLPVL